MLRLIIREPGTSPLRESELTRAQTWHDVTGAVCVQGYVDGRNGWLRWPGLAFRFAEEGVLEAFPDRPMDPALIRDIARRTVEPLALQALGWETLHASSVKIAGAICAFCGERESGKSTLAYALSRRGYPQYSDDALVLQIESSCVRALKLPFGARLRIEPAAHFGFQPDARYFQDVTALSHDSGLASTEPVAAVFALRRDESCTQPIVEPLGPGQALAAVMAHAHCFNPSDGMVRQRILKNYLDLVAALPVYALRFGSGLERLGAVLECIEAALAVRQPEPV